MLVHPASQPVNQLRPVTIRDGSCYIRWRAHHEEIM